MISRGKKRKQNDQIRIRMPAKLLVLLCTIDFPSTQRRAIYATLFTLPDLGLCQSYND